MNIIAISNNMYNETSLFDKSNVIYVKDKLTLSVDLLKKINPKYIFFPHWSYIIPAEIYDNFNCVIFHMTDVPFGRGGSPLQNLISRSIYQTKISAIRCGAEIDGGEVYLKRDFSLKEGSALELYIKAGEIVSEMIDEIIEKNPKPIPQQGNVVKFNRRPPQESNIANVENIETVHDYIRMLDAPGYPHAFFINNGIKFSFSNSKLENGKVFANVEIEKI